MRISREVIMEPNNHLNDAIWNVDFAFDTHPQFFDRIAELEPLRRSIKKAIRQLAVEVGWSGFPDHSNRKNPDFGPLDYLDRAENYFLKHFYDLLAENERTPALENARTEIARLFIEANKLLA